MLKVSDILLEHIREKRRGFKSNDVVKVLKFTYHCCVAFERLLYDAGHEITRDSESYGSFDWNLSEYYIRHLEEERGEIHVLIKDLSSVGVDATLLPTDPLAAAMIGTQYYWIKHLHPVCLLGCMAIQETAPIPMEAVEALESVYGASLFRFLRMHAIKDLEHSKELIELIDAAPEDKQKLIMMSADNSLAYLEAFYGGRQC